MWFSEWLKIDEALPAGLQHAGLASMDFQAAADDQELDRGGSPFHKIDEFIDKYLDAYKGWKTTPDEIAPGNGGGGWAEFDDMFAVLVGRKRAVWLGTIVNGSEDQKLIVRRSIQRMVNDDPKMAKNLSYMKVFDDPIWKGWDRKTNTHSGPKQRYDDIVIGPEKVIDDLRHLIRYERLHMQKGTCTPMPLTKAIGQLLGYHAEGAARYCQWLCSMTNDEGQTSRDTQNDSLSKHFRTSRLRFPQVQGFDPDNPQ
jgi:hypothetical protein